ncbi:MAG: tyrosine-type recombinase/integrase, partial [Oscillospiraceae bacterium]|nr:tyrosine-type recombinase/integrase [Oscillospiraceae bacterium]
MPRPKKPTYEYVPKLQRYRKRIKDVDGKYVAIYGKTPEELEAKLAAAEEVIAEGIERNTAPITVRQYAEKWIELNTGEMGEKHRESTLNAVNNHILPQIGDMALRDIKADDARAVMAALDGKSKSLRSKVLGAMRRIFDAAEENGLIKTNPCARLRPGGKKAQRKEALTPAQVETLLAAITGTRAETFVRLGLYSGLRREEALALQWDCVDLAGDFPSLKVRRALRWSHNRPVVNELLKTDAAYRTIPLPEQLAKYLKRQKPKKGYVIGGAEALSETQWKNLWRHVTDRQTGEKSYQITTKDGYRRVIFNRELGAKSKGGNFYYTIDFNVTPHLLRHTYCTNLILGGANVKKVQYLMGHADVKVTLDIYAHVIETSPEVLMIEINKA